MLNEKICSLERQKQTMQPQIGKTSATAGSRKKGTSYQGTREGINLESGYSIHTC